LNYLVDAHLAGDHYHAAEDAARDMLKLSRALYHRAPGNAAVIDDLMGALNQSAKLALLQKDQGLARARLDELKALPLTAAQKAASASRWLDRAVTEWWLGASTPEAAELKAAAQDWLAKVQAAGGTPRPDLMVRFEALSGNPSQAAQWLAKLTGVERAHPFVREFCRQTRGCGDPAATAARSN